MQLNGKGYGTCSGSTWQNMEIFSLTKFSSGVAQRHMICWKHGSISRAIFAIDSTLSAGRESDDERCCCKHHQIGGQAQSSQLTDTVLGRLGLLFSCSTRLQHTPNRDSKCIGTVCARQKAYTTCWMATLETERSVCLCPCVCGRGCILVQLVDSYLWYETDMDVAEVLFLDLELELSKGFDERHALNVPYSAP